MADIPLIGPGSNSGHGHVWERPDGLKARCGGPVMCTACASDYATWLAPSIVAGSGKPALHIAIKRYRPVIVLHGSELVTKMIECPLGEYMRFSDFEALRSAGLLPDAKS